MRNFLRSAIIALIVLLIFALHVAAANLLPYPLNRINVILISAMWLLIFNRENKIVYIFALSLISELFLSTPFGLNTFAILIACAALEWILLNILTNRFFFMVFLAGLIGAFLFKASFFALFFALKIFGLAAMTMNQTVIINALIELLINAAALMIIYLISLLFVKRYNPKYVSDR